MNTHVDVCALQLTSSLMLLFLSHPSLKNTSHQTLVGILLAAQTCKSQPYLPRALGRSSSMKLGTCRYCSIFSYCNTHHYNFSFLQNLRVGTMACHVKLAVPNTTAAVGLLRCWYGIWNYRPLVMWKDMRAPSCRSSTLGSGGNFKKGTN